MKKVLIPTKLNAVAADILKEKGYTVVQDAETPLEDLAKANSDSEVLIVRSEKVTAEIIDCLPKLKLVVRAGAGYNTIDTKYARKKKVDVMNTPGANSNAVAEEVIALILAAARHVVKGDISTRSGLWEKKNFMGTEVSSKTIGILGMGNIGRLLVKRLKGFDMKFLAYDPVLSADLAEKIGVELCSVEEIFSKADFISLHIPENDATRGMINKNLLSKMKKGAMLINCARAGVINEDDLRAIKAEKEIIFCNDVYPKDAAGDKSVADIADVMLPHLGASTVEANYVAAKRSAEQTIGYFEKGITTCVVNKGVPDGLDEQYQNLAFTLTKLARAYLGENTPPHKIETSFYGNLHQYGKWMLAPIAAGISSEFDPYMDAADAEEFLKERGIEIADREVSDDKNYGESMTIDLFEGKDTINKVSIRGTIAEGNLMISRINDFDKLYLEPSGHNLMVGYHDEPGVIGKIASILGEKSINILDLRAPQDLKSGRSLAVIKTNLEVPGELISKIRGAVNACVAFSFSC
jgi:D-3-phosphoglycerate dehydrogenase